MTFGGAFTHNPEVIGSRPASATIKTTAFAVVFLTFWHKMEPVKMGLELVAENAKIKRRENTTFARKL